MNNSIIDLIVGAKPNLIKIASILRALDHAQDQNLVLYYCLVHTRQHYDEEMLGSSFNQLGIPKLTLTCEWVPDSLIQLFK